jgi:hypothetical protein
VRSDISLHNNKCHENAASEKSGPIVYKTQKYACENTNGLVNIINGIAHSSAFSEFVQCTGVNGVGNTNGTGIREYSCSSIINGYVKSVVRADDTDKVMVLSRRQLHGENVEGYKQDDLVGTTHSNAANSQHIKV